MNHLTCLLLVTLLSLSAWAQTRKAAPKTSPQKRAVTVKTKQGQAISGNFLGASLDAIKVESTAGPRSISLDDVVSINFGDVKNRERAHEAVRALQALSSGTEIGLSYPEYSRRIVDVKIVVDGALRSIDDAALYEAISISLRYFEDALLYWRGDVQDGVKHLILPEKSIRELETKYGPEVRDAVSLIPNSENKQVVLRKLVAAVWAAAQRKTERAARLLE